MTILRPYIYRHTPYRPPPLYQGLGSRVLQGHRDPGSRVTMGHRVTMVTGLIGSQGHWVIGSITRVFSISMVSMVRVSMVTMVLGHRVTMVTITMVLNHGSPITREIESPITRVTGLPSPWFRVTYNHGLTMVGCYVWILPAHHL